MGSALQRNADGSLTPATALGWQGSGVDWEVYSTERPRRAVAYDEDVCVAQVRARTRIGLVLKIRRAQRRLTRDG